MAKSHGRRTIRYPAGVRGSRPAFDPDTPQDALERLSAMLAADPADPVQVVALPPLFLDTVVARYPLLPAERCVDDAVVLAHAYAQLGLDAQVRATVLTVTGGADGLAAYGSLAPQWQGDLFDGHTVVWLPTARYLVDPSAEQFPQIAGVSGGSVIAAGEQAGPTDAARLRVRARREELLLAYTLAPSAATAAVLAHPVARAQAERNYERGINVASAVVAMLAELLPPTRVRLIPYPRAVALIDAVRGLPMVGNKQDDRRFLLPGPHGAVVTRLDEIPLPADTPPLGVAP
jgi:hypothetical protein